MNEVTLQKVGRSRRTGLNLLCSVAEHLISGGIALLLTPFLIDRLGIETYGLYPIVLELSAVFGIVFGVVNSTSGRYIAVEEERGSAGGAQKYFSSAFFANAALGIVALVPMGALVALSDRFLNVPRGVAQELRIFMILAFAAVVVDALASAFGSVYYITNRLDLRSGQQLVSAALKAILLALLLGIFRPSLVGVGVAILVSVAAGSLVQILVARKLTPAFSVSLSSFSFPATRRLMASGLWYSFNRVAAFLMGGAMLIMANSFFESSVSGLYSVAFVVVNALSGVVMTLAAVFVPVSAKCFARGERNRLRDSLARDEKLIGCFAAVAVSVSIGFGGDFLGLWVGEEASRLLVAITSTLLVPVLSLACAAPIINVAMVMDRTRRLSLFFLGGGILTVAAALFSVFFTGVGVIGLAVVSCLAQVLWYSVAVPIFACRVLECSPKVFLLPVLRVFAAAALSLGACLAINGICDIKSWFGLAVAVGCSATVSSVISFFTLFYGKSAK